MTVPHLHNGLNYLMLEWRHSGGLLHKRNPSWGISVSTIESDERRTEVIAHEG